MSEIRLKTDAELEKMRQAGKLAAQVLEYVGQYVAPGVSTGYLNRLAEEFTLSHGAVSAPLNYNGFPQSICTSVNQVVCHGIPSDKHILKSGDIINIDITVILDGFHGDTSATYCVGEVSEKARLLVEHTEKAMYKGIKAIKPGAYLSDAGKAIEKYVRKFGYSIVREYGGHGIGRAFHEPPQVFHHYTPENRIVLKKGMIFTIEPMINMGRNWRVTTSREDGWTVTTIDGSLSAQFEHTVAVVDSGVEILTKV
ncbi:MAG: type I methionyl aminopeptidase [Candidatus Cloacimonetes bacterium]|nr:type I methionyl aminopeptidase [Candidatus Cloacimonadota bacterium]